MSQIVPSNKQQNMAVQKALLDALSAAIGPDTKVLIITDAGFQNAGFRHLKSPGWDFIGHVRGNIHLRLEKKAGTGSDATHYRPAANRNIWGRERWPVQSMPAVTAIFIFIKKRLKTGKISGVVVAYPVTLRSVMNVLQQKSRGLSSAARTNLSPAKS